MDDRFTIESGSTEYVTALVGTPTRAGVTYDPTGDTVEFAFIAVGADVVAGTVWTAGEWETRRGKYYAKCLVGPGVLELSEGTYTVFVRITSAPEIPVKRAGLLRVA